MLALALKVLRTFRTQFNCVVSFITLPQDLTIPLFYMLTILPKQSKNKLNTYFDGFYTFIFYCYTNAETNIMSNSKIELGSFFKVEY